MDPEREFDVTKSERIPPQRTVRPEAPPDGLAALVRFLEEIEEIFGPITRPERPKTGDRFLL
jgi:hypothetical protein